MRRPRAENDSLLDRKESEGLTYAELAEVSSVPYSSLIRWLARVRRERQHEGASPSIAFSPQRAHRSRSFSQAGLASDPLNGSVYVFLNRARDRVKLLHWDGNGLWLHSSLESGPRRGFSVRGANGSGFVSRRGSEPGQKSPILLPRL